MKIRATSLTATAVLALAGIFAAPAGAGHSASTDVTLRVGTSGSQAPLFGRVTSDEPACVPDRRVLIIEVAPEHAPIDLADDPTNAKGKWTFTSQLQGGTAFQAKVKPRKAGGVTCEGALSPVGSF